MLALAGELREFEMPRPIFTNSEKIDLGATSLQQPSRGIAGEDRPDEGDQGAGHAARNWKTARGQLAPFLRDTLVGLNYAYYEPPGAQMLHNNPLFVRSHDFSGMTIMGSDRLWQAPELLGAGTPAGGGAYLMGSLADLPYALAPGGAGLHRAGECPGSDLEGAGAGASVERDAAALVEREPERASCRRSLSRTGEELLAASAKDPQASRAR